jgi:hypothetical protein
MSEMERASQSQLPQKAMDIYVKNWSSGEFLKSLKSEKINKSLCVLQKG